MRYEALGIELIRQSQPPAIVLISALIKILLILLSATCERSCFDGLPCYEILHIQFNALAPLCLKYGQMSLAIFSKRDESSYMSLLATVAVLVIEPSAAIRTQRDTSVFRP